ncbi:transcriptional regulator, TetR family [Beutenbergia cavernae DSM 12333]|uniref:Transcriptional regulator, TetR family n=1 Tax=Beutenbergia cavernae (strain ATCC BAA-8 / DSM 12333 / CCUG 43141 / JCM 11478 / NBRC 16432 / NCIMB 13614 / HKI 0122) TaxID=471853 RepID=C5BWZ4_BEUC1|nr:TetR/AcrR family transcriptional regulator [Beutenbergia cavernae]ACQ80810.1 transcriptional regulator, TetR family [Beutenbergia cavernae DSM 12333]
MSKGEATRGAILDVAVATAYRVGLGGLTIGELARTADMSKSGLYAHFRSKEALQLAVLDAARRRFVDRVVRPALATPRGEARLRELVDRWLAAGLSREPGCSLFVKASTELDEQEGPVRDALTADHRDLLDTIAQVFRTCVAEGDVAEDADPDQFATDLDGIMLAFYHAHRLLRDPDAELRARRAFENLLAAARP